MNTALTAKDLQNDFLGASDAILKEAKQIIENESECLTLVEFGFKNVKKAKEYLSVKNAKRLRETVEYYQIHYPFNKFITYEYVQKLCEKYGLFCGETEQYSGEVPLKNLDDIVKFRVKDLDLAAKSSGWMSWSSREEDLNRYFLTEGQWAQTQPESREIPLRICAPYSMFDKQSIRHHEIKDGFMLVSDPVVLHPVRGGYLIVTAWGDEASDPIVVNPVNN